MSYILMLCVLSASAPAMAEMQWHRRVLIISTPNAPDSQFLAQQQALSQWTGGDDRDVSVVRIEGDAVTGSSESAKELRATIARPWRSRNHRPMTNVRHWRRCSPSMVATHSICRRQRRSAHVSAGRLNASTPCARKCWPRFGPRAIRTRTPGAAGFVTGNDFAEFSPTQIKRPHRSFEPVRPWIIYPYRGVITYPFRPCHPCHRRPVRHVHAHRPSASPRS